MVIGYRVVQAGFRFQSGDAAVGQLEKLFAKISADWTRWDEHGWLLYTNRSLESLHDSIREADARDEFLLCEMTPGSYFGYLGDGVRDWLGQFN